MRFSDAILGFAWVLMTGCSAGGGVTPSQSSGESYTGGYANAGGFATTGGASNAGTGGSSPGGGSTAASGGAQASGGDSGTSSGGTSSGGESGAVGTSTGGSPPSSDAGSVDQPTGGSDVTPAKGYLHTSGSKIVDWQGNEVRLTGLSWFGMETSNYAPHGLWTRSLASFLDQIEQLGYNSLRIPFSTQMFDAGSTPNGIDQNSNADLIGLSPLEILDKVVAGARARGLKVILDRHRPDSGSQSPLWYTAQYSEARWIDDWKMLATHYLGDPTVVGFDLHNEPHDTASWGDGNPQTDFRAAAERAGNAVLAVNPQLLIIVEGVQTIGTSSSWWGGNLQGARTAPVNLSVKNRLVYSIHDYPPSVYDQPWFQDASYPSNLPAFWDQMWGYLVDSNTAPVWIGEFGTKLQTDADKKWLAALASYIQEKKLSFAYWCWNPNSGDTGGILQDDWTTVNQNKQDVLQPLLAPKIP